VVVAAESVLVVEALVLCLEPVLQLPLASQLATMTIPAQVANSTDKKELKPEQNCSGFFYAPQLVGSIQAGKLPLKVTRLAG